MHYPAIRWARESYDKDFMTTASACPLSEWAHLYFMPRKIGLHLWRIVVVWASIWYKPREVRSRQGPLYNTISFLPNFHCGWSFKGIPFYLHCETLFIWFWFWGASYEFLGECFVSKIALFYILIKPDPWIMQFLGLGKSRFFVETYELWNMVDFLIHDCQTFG